MVWGISSHQRVAPRAPVKRNAGSASKNSALLELQCQYEAFASSDPNKRRIHVFYNMLLIVCMLTGRRLPGCSAEPRGVSTVMILGWCISGRATGSAASDEFFRQRKHACPRTLKIASGERGNVCQVISMCQCVATSFSLQEFVIFAPIVDVLPILPIFFFLLAFLWQADDMQAIFAQSSQCRGRCRLPLSCWSDVALDCLA